VLSRPALLASLSASNLLSLVPPEVRTLYELLTSDFSPLELCAQVAPLLTALEGIKSPMSAACPVRDLDLGAYVASLKQVAVLRLLRQLQDVYSTLRIPALAKLVPFCSFAELEAIVVDGVKYGFLAVRIDHRQGTLAFGGAALEAERLRGQLSTLARRLAKAVAWSARRRPRSARRPAPPPSARRWRAWSATTRARWRAS